MRKRPQQLGYLLNRCYRLSSKKTPKLYFLFHYSDVIMGAMASQITRLTIVYSTVYSGTDQRKYQSTASLAFVRGIHLGLVNSPHKWPITRKMFPLHDVIMWKEATATGDFPSQRASNAERVPMSWRIHVSAWTCCLFHDWTYFHFTGLVLWYLSMCGLYLVKNLCAYHTKCIHYFILQYKMFMWPAFLAHFWYTILWPLLLTWFKSIQTLISNCIH